MTRSQRLATLAGFAALHLAIDYFAPLALYRAGGKLGPLANVAPFGLAGVLWGQWSLLTSYDVLGAGRAGERAWTSALLALGGWYALTASIVATGDSFEIGSREQFLAVVFSLACLALATFHGGCRLLGRGFWEHVEGAPAQDALRSGQFRLRDLLLGMFAAAVVSALAATPIGRELWAKRWNVGPGDCARLAIGVAMISQAAWLAAFPVAWGLLGPRLDAKRLAYAAAAWLAVVCLAWLLVRSMFREGNASLVAFLVGVACETALAASVLRWLGYRQNFSRRKPLAVAPPAVREEHP